MELVEELPYGIAVELEQIETRRMDGCESRR